MAREPFERLRCWRFALKLNAEVHRLSSVLPADEKGGLAMAMKRASQANAMKIAEAEGRDEPNEAIAQLESAHAALRELLAVALVCKSLKMLRLLHLRRLRALVAKQRLYLDREIASWEGLLQSDHPQESIEPAAVPVDVIVPAAPTAVPLRTAEPIIRLNSPKLAPVPIPHG